LKNRAAIFNTSLKAATLVLLIFSTMTARAQLIPLPNAFAHNDYRHKHPLYDALQNGYTNIEADIFLKGGRLIVAHINPYFKHNHTLEALYLKPLADRVANNNGQVYDGYKKPVILMIDIKTDSDKTYTALKVLLERYKLMLSSFKNGKIAVGAITVVLSGHKPCDMLMKEPDRLAFIDEDLRKASRDSSRIDVYQMASCKYSTLLKWRGTGLMPNDEEKKLCAYVAIAHKNGEKVRLWASPENNTVWQQLLKCGVDLINTDKLAQLKRFLLLQKPVLLSSAMVAKPADNSQTALITL
jgi:hypothetical protein